jgi:2-iminobutanoate/2-iminopropanoate deaminase
LKAVGAGPEHVVKVQVFMTDVMERPKINPRRMAYFGQNLPASTLVEVKGLDPRMKVEIECQAYVD